MARRKAAPKVREWEFILATGTPNELGPVDVKGRVGKPYASKGGATTAAKRYLEDLRFQWAEKFSARAGEEIGAAIEGINRITDSSWDYTHPDNPIVFKIDLDIDPVIFVISMWRERPRT